MIFTVEIKYSHIYTIYSAKIFRSLLGPDLLIVHLHVAADTMRERMEKRHSGNKNIVDELEVMSSKNYLTLLLCNFLSSIFNIREFQRC